MMRSIFFSCVCALTLTLTEYNNFQGAGIFRTSGAHCASPNPMDGFGTLRSMEGKGAGREGGRKGKGTDGKVGEGRRGKAGGRVLAQCSYID